MPPNNSPPNPLLRAAARSVLEVTGPAVGDPAAVLPAAEIAKRLWEHWTSERGEPERKADLLALSEATPTLVRAEVAAVVPEAAADQPPAVTANLSAYLAWIPTTVRRTLRPLENDAARTPAEFLPQHPEDLVPFLPTRLPQFRVGDRPLPGVDLQLVELLGVGGFGEVWKAVNPDFDGVPPVALKFCRDPRARDRLLRHEASVLNHVMRHGRHPGIVPLLRTYLTADPPCLEYEYVEGGDLTTLARRWRKRPGPAQTEMITRVVARLAEIVGFAHRLGPPIVHRDLKPANVLVQKAASGKAVLRVADFGIGGLAARHLIEETTACGPDQGRFLTSAMRGAFTPLYASPQQMRGDAPDPRDDVYALGVVWYQLLIGDLAAGRPGGRHWFARLRAQGLTQELVELLASCFEDDPADRPVNAAALAEEINARGAAPPPSSAGRGSGIDLAGHVQNTLRQVGKAHKRARDLVEYDHDYDEAARVLEGVPEHLRDASFFDLVHRARGQIAQLDREIEEAVRANRFANLRAKVGALLELQPQRADLRRLLEALVTEADLPAFLTNSVGMRLALLPAGTFRMGSPGHEQDRSLNEGPEREVTLRKPFYIGVYPVTQAQYEAVMGVNPAYFNRQAGGGPGHPVEQVSWDDAVEFCRRLSALPEEKGAWRLYRLPTEAEWEYACRAGTTTPWYGGTSHPVGRANFNGSFPYAGAPEEMHRTSPVDKYPPNPFGLYDMIGNVWEWCADWYAADAYARASGDPPEGPPSGTYRVLRGASWDSPGRMCRSACRNMGAPDKRANHVGFRVVLAHGIKTA
jgi:formylglycine-generating enzyme required for sulfatase activity